MEESQEIDFIKEEHDVMDMPDTFFSGENDNPVSDLKEQRDGLCDWTNHRIGGNEREFQGSCVSDEEDRKWEIGQSPGKEENEEVGNKFGGSEREENVPKVKPVSECHICGKKFCSIYSLRRHLLMYTDVVQFKCIMCEEGLKCKSNVHFHMRKNIGGKSYKCTICGEEFARPNQLKIHRRTHIGEIPFNCTICSKGCTRPSSFKIHMRTHTGETRFKCRVCKKGFSRKEHVVNHIRCHM